MNNPRLIIAIITNLLDEAIIAAFIIFGLPRLGVNIPLWGLILIGIGFLVYAVGFYLIGSKVLRKKPLPGLTNMVGVEGKVVSPLAPKGFIRAEGELWSSKADNGFIDIGADVIIIEQRRLELIVRRKMPSDYSAMEKKL
jgi:membrane-bound ClpP family serine protease